MHRFIGSILVVTWLAHSSGIARPREVGSWPDLDSIAGCYKVERTDWQPRVDLGKDSFYVRLPPLLIADSDRVARSLPGWRVLRSLDPRDKDSPVTRKMWRRIGPGRIEIIWAPDGLSGVSGRLDRTETGFRGEVRTFWDFSRTRQ